MLLEDFYTVLDSKTSGEGTLQVSVAINQNHEIFKGHFPKHPVTPGVAMLQILKNCLESHFKRPLRLQTSSNIKFLALVKPNEQANLLFTIDYSIENASIKVKNNTSFMDGSSVLKCNATFVKK